MCNFLGAITLAGTYLIYSFVCLTTILYIFLLYPETKGKTLNRIAQELRKISLTTRICNNIKSLPVTKYLDWIIKFGDEASQIPI